MRWRCGMISLLLVLACAAPPASAAEAVEPVPALPREGATQLLDNARGIAWDIVSKPGIPTALHRHASDFVAVELVKTQVRITGTDGKTEARDLTRGAAAMLPKDLTHIEEVAAGRPARRTIVIELKDAPSPSYMNSGALADGFPKGGRSIVAIDNARLTITDARWSGSATSGPFFQSRDIFLVTIDPGEISIATANGPPRVLPLISGQVVFVPGGRDRTIAAVKGSVRAAVVELK